MYVQYPGMPEPNTLWPSVKWEQITSQYAGLFFRAEGGTSLSFDGGQQNDISPRIIAAYQCNERDCSANGNINFIYSDGITATSQLRTAMYTNSYWETISFRTQHKEVIPKNMSIRIYKRTS